MTVMGDQGRPTRGEIICLLILVALVFFGVLLLLVVKQTGDDMGGPS